MLGIFYLLFPWFSTGSFDQTNAVFGMMFLTIGIVRAKPSISVIGGIMMSFLGMAYFFGSIAFLEMSFVWMLSIIMFGAFLVFELGYLKIGPSTSTAKAFILVPLALLTFSLALAFVGRNPIIAIDFTNLWVALNYVAILAFSLFTMLGIAGWRVMGPSTDKWIMMLAILAVATAFLGVYQGSLVMWNIFPL
jgi:hypothetical protein